MSDAEESGRDGHASSAAGDAVRVSVGDGATLTLPPEASDGEAAAIVAAVGAHLTDLDRAAAAAADEREDEPGWDGRRWGFAGRTESVRGEPARPTDGTPTDPWTAAGRADRL